MIDNTETISMPSPLWVGNPIQIPIDRHTPAQKARLIRRGSRIGIRATPLPAINPMRFELQSRTWSPATGWQPMGEWELPDGTTVFTDEAHHA